MPERKSAEEDRRRSARFSCGGQAKITPLPSSGVLIPGTIRDLSLHGCCVDTARPIDRGVKTEIIVRVNAASFRAVSEVKALHGPSLAGMEFVHLSAGGKDLLAEMLTELARLQTVMNKLRSARREMDEESFRQQLESGQLEAAILSERFPILGTIWRAESLEKGSEPEQPDSGSPDRIVQAQPLVIAVDLFG